MSTSLPTFVVLPVKDRFELTASLVEQLAAQGGYETLFILDNGSTDGSTDWLRRRSATARLEVVEAPDRQIYELWNLGAGLARARAGLQRCLPQQRPADRAPVPPPAGRGAPQRARPVGRVTQL